MATRTRAYCQEPLLIYCSTTAQSIHAISLSKDKNSYRSFAISLAWCEAGAYIATLSLHGDCALTAQAYGLYLHKCKCNHSKNIIVRKPLQASFLTRHWRNDITVGVAHIKYKSSLCHSEEQRMLQRGNPT